MVNAVTIADRITQQYRFARDGGGRLYVFDGGLYRPTGEDWVRQCVKQIHISSNERSQWSSFRAREACEYIRTDAPLLWDLSYARDDGLEERIR